MIRLVLFDIDGTLVHTGGAGVKAFAKVFESEFGAKDHFERLKFAGRTDVSLVCASATAAALRASPFGAPTYVITGAFPDRPDGGADDRLTAELIERARLGLPLEAA